MIMLQCTGGTTYPLQTTARPMSSVFGHKCARCCYVSPHLCMGLQHIPCTKYISQTISPSNSVISYNDCVVCVSDERDMDTKEGNGQQLAHNTQVLLHNVSGSEVKRITQVVVYTHTLRGQVALGYRHVQGFPANYCAECGVQLCGRLDLCTRKIARNWAHCMKLPGG